MPGRSALPLTAILLLTLARPAAAGLHADGTPCALSQTPAELLAPIAVAPSTMRAALVPERRGALPPLDIVIRPGAGLAANQAALDAFERAAAGWEAVLRDPGVEVFIDADLADFGEENENVIGSTAARVFETSFNVVRGRVVADGADEFDDSITAFLPTADQFFAFLPAGFGLTGNLAAAKPNLKAIGFTGLDTMFGELDGTITFNSRYSFDFDSSDGVGVGMVDFETVAAHEIGHALGFLSVVDIVDGVLAGPGLQHGGAWSATGIDVPGGASGPILIPTTTTTIASVTTTTTSTTTTTEPPPVAVTPRLLDLYRFREHAAEDPETREEFRDNPRNLVPGLAANFDEIDQVEVAMSTGREFGDGRQASHWRDDALEGVRLGVMDPTLDDQEIFTISFADLRAFDLIGYEVATGTGSTTLPTTSTTTSTLPPTTTTSSTSTTTEAPTTTTTSTTSTMEPTTTTSGPTTTTLGASTTTTLAGGCPGQCGDPTGDGFIRASDALFALAAAVGRQSCEVCLCDANGDLQVRASDALAILRAAVGLPVVLACPEA